MATLTLCRAREQPEKNGRHLSRVIRIRFTDAQYASFREVAHVTELRETIEIPLTAQETQDAVLRYFRERRNPQGETEIELRVPLRGLGVAKGLEVVHLVRVHVRRRRDLQNLNDEIEIEWEPSDDGLYPAFSGWLIVWSEQPPERSFIELRGSYEPPLGTTGRAFDTLVGRIIARQTARLLLEDLKAAISTPSQSAHESEPAQQQIEALVRDEERGELQDEAAPGEVKSEILERLDRFAETDLERSRADWE
jgi:hypothetical protein